MQFLNDAMRSASSMVRRKVSQPAATKVEERNSATMMLLRAHDQGSDPKVRRAVSLYPRLQVWTTRSSANILALKEHAVELCREQIWSRVDELKGLQSRSDNEFATKTI